MEDVNSRRERLADLGFDPADPDQLVDAFKARYPFPLDEFQDIAIRELAEGDSVMVAAPTGTGKTVVAEFGVFRAYVRGWRVMYTTPIKALSNQKFRDLREQYGDAVGLLTGDIIENREGSILVMTTEVLRNMLLQTPSELWGVGCIVFDEIHYLADEERGTTWEEAIIMCPKDIQLACLSATVSNAPELAEWITRTHRPIRLITHYQRAVPLNYYYYLDGALNLIIDETGRQVASFPNVGGELRRHMRGSQFGTGRETEGTSARERPEPTAREIISALEAREMLPAIFFLFSRRDCEAAAEVCAMMRMRAVQDSDSRGRIEAVLAKYMDRLTAEDRELEQVKTIVYLVRRGFGFHHAGLLPILKQLVEELFSAALMRVVFATDTLALGINMPARAVVIGRMNKWDGVQRRPLIPNEFQQMAGRAGRRGIDPQGYVVMPYSPWVPFNEALGIATGPLRPVESAFTIRYNTVLNLWNPPDGDRVLDVMRHSLLQFQQSRRLYDLEAAVEEWDRELEEIPTGCLIGLPEGESLLDEYESLGRALETARDRERKLVRNRERIDASRADLPWRRPEREYLRRLLRLSLPGTVMHLEGLGWAVYLGGNGGGRIGFFWVGERIVSLDQYSTIDFIPPGDPVIQLPPELAAAPDWGTQQAQDYVVGSDAQALMRDQLAAIDLPDLTEWLLQHRTMQQNEIEPQLAQLDSQIVETREYTLRIAGEERAHPCHTCPVRKQHRSNRRRREKAEAGRQESLRFLEGRRAFEESRLTTLLGGMVSVLRRFYYLDREGNPTPKAARLMDIFDTNALMISELIESGYLNGMQPVDLAEIFSWFAYDRDVEFRNRHLLPGHLVRLRERLDDLQREVFQTERRYDLMISTGYNPYFYGAARAWGRGATMGELLSKVDLSEGDLVATFNKTLDLMRQVREMLSRAGGYRRSSAARLAASGATELIKDETELLHDSLKEAEDLLRRGVVAMTYNIGFVEQQTPGIDGARQDLDADVVPDRSPFVSTGFEDVDRMLGLLADPEATSPPPLPREEGMERVFRSRRSEDQRPRRTDRPQAPEAPARPGSAPAPDRRDGPPGGGPGRSGTAPQSRPRPRRRDGRR